MAKTFMPELDPDQRRRLLQDNNDGFEETTYYKDLSQDDLDIKRESLSTNLIQLSTWEDELQVVKDQYKSLMKPVKNSNTELLDQIKTKKEKVVGTIYHIADHENGVMETFDESGEFISSRRLRPDERQLKAFPLRKASGE